jgi:hypothetical protein
MGLFPVAKNQEEAFETEEKRPHLSMGLALSQIANDLVRPPQALASGRQ